MSANALTVVVGVAGIVASLLFSIFFYLGGKHASRAERLQLLQEIQESRDTLKNVFKEMTDRFPTKSDVRRALASAGNDQSAMVEVTDQLRSDASSSAIEVLVRASLGALVNERGEVALPRLMREVGQAIGSPRISEVVEVLGKLRSKGIVGWDGNADDLSGVQTIRVHAAKRPAADSDAVGGSALDEARRPVP